MSRRPSNAIIPPDPFADPQLRQRSRSRSRSRSRQPTSLRHGSSYSVPHNLDSLHILGLNSSHSPPHPFTTAPQGKLDRNLCDDIAVQHQLLPMDKQSHVTTSSDFQLHNLDSSPRHPSASNSNWLPLSSTRDPSLTNSPPTSAILQPSLSVIIPPPSSNLSNHESDRVNLATDESVLMSPLTAAHAAATLTELAFLKSLLSPALTRHDVHLLVGTRVQRLIRDDDAGRLRKLSPISLASRRFPAIILTVVLELGVGAVVGTFGRLLERHVVLVSFMPMISSICGNIGLQASTSTLRALATGYTSHSTWPSVRKVLLREFSAGLAIGSMLFVGLSLMIMLWASSFRTGIVCGLSIMFSSSAAGIMGALAPIGFKGLGLDPALCAGPLETAVQDLIGISTYLLMAEWLLP